MMYKTSVLHVTFADSTPSSSFISYDMNKVIPSLLTCQDKVHAGLKKNRGSASGNYIDQTATNSRGVSRKEETRLSSMALYIVGGL
jgi:hypothetical protein